MNRSTFFLLVVAVSLAAACSQSSSEATPGTGGAGTTQLDYKKICERLVPLAPQSRAADFAKTCESDYRAYLPACKNAAAVNECFTKLAAWGERLACIDSCARDPAPAK